MSPFRKALIFFGLAEAPPAQLRLPVIVPAPVLEPIHGPIPSPMLVGGPLVDRLAAHHGPQRLPWDQEPAAGHEVPEPIELGRGYSLELPWPPDPSQSVPADLPGWYEHHVISRPKAPVMPGWRRDSLFGTPVYPSSEHTPDGGA